MKYDINDETFTGFIPPKYITLDGVYIYACQSADDEKGIVTFPALTDDGRLYFSRISDDFIILTRTGKVEFHDIPNNWDIEIQNSMKEGKFLKPFPYEIPESAESIG